MQKGGDSVFQHAPGVLANLIIQKVVSREAHLGPIDYRMRLIG
jgi:hypothetical protein